MKQTRHLSRRWISMLLAFALVLSAFSGILPGSVLHAEAANDEIANNSLRITVGDLGQISTLNIVNNPKNNSGREINFVLPNNKMTDKFASEIYAFYRAGILTGSDAKGTFRAASTIKRSEVAAIVLRMFDTTARKSITP